MPVRKRGKYSYQVYFKENGKQVVHGTYDTEEEAHEKDAELKKNKNRNTSIDYKRGQIKVSVALKEYEEHCSVHNRGYDQYDKYKFSAWRKDLKFNDKMLSEVKPSDIKRYIDDRLKDDIAANSINRELNLLSAFFSFCKVHYDGLEWLENPVGMVNRPKCNDSRDVTVERNSDNEKNLLEALRKSPSDWIYYVYQLAVNTGMRRSEITKALWKDVKGLDTDSPVLEIPASNTKTMRNRTVPLSPDAVKAIKGLQELGIKYKQDDDRLAGRRQNAVKNDYSKLLYGVTPSGISQAFKKACDEAGIENLRFHDLRHTFTSRMFETNLFSIPEISSITGHTSLASLKRYTNFTAVNLSKKMRALATEENKEDE